METQLACDLKTPVSELRDGAENEAPKRPTLGDVLSRSEAKLQGAALRDTRSAFAVLVRTGIRIESVAATATEVREALSQVSTHRLHVSEKRLANVRSLVVRAVEKFGRPSVSISKKTVFDGEWQRTLSLIADEQHRWGVSRLARFCSFQGIAPERVCVETLRPFFEALCDDITVTKPRNLLKHTIAIWNMCRKRVDGWPNTSLSSPFKTEASMLPFESFPASFQADVASWEARMRHPDPLDPSAPARALREDTLKGYRFTFRRIASALVRARAVRPEDVIGLRVFFDEDNFRISLREYLPQKGAASDYVHKMATQLIVVARVHLGFNETKLNDLRAIADRVKPSGGRVMGERNRLRLGQFDDYDVVQKLLRFPEEELARALRLNNPIRRAKGVERALAVSLGIFTGLRIKNLRSLCLQRNVRRRGERVFIEFSADETKTYRSLSLELPAETIALLDLFVVDHRPGLPGSRGSYLFPGENGGPRSYSAMRITIERPILKHTGITLSPHLLRHITAKIVVERQPELAIDVSRRLGHNSLRTTYASYLGTEGPAASRRINALLQDVRGSAVPS